MEIPHKMTGTHIWIQVMLAYVTLIISQIAAAEYIICNLTIYF